MRHLASEQVESWVIGERTAEEEQHVRECSSCRAEVERLAETFALFRESGERWGEHWYGAPAPRATARPRHWGISSAMAACLVAAAVLFLQPVPTARVDAPFLEIPYTAPLAPYERTSVMRMDVPVAALVAFGFEVHGPEPGGTVTADVLVGQDGRPRALRLISQRSVIR